MILYDAYYMFTSAVESFERIVSLYAQQLSLNETQHFVTPSLTLITELVSTNLMNTIGAKPSALWDLLQ